MGASLLHFIFPIKTRLVQKKVSLASLGKIGNECSIKVDYDEFCFANFIVLMQFNQKSQNEH